MAEVQNDPTVVRAEVLSGENELGQIQARTTHSKNDTLTLTGAL